MRTAIVSSEPGVRGSRPPLRLAVAVWAGIVGLAFALRIFGIAFGWGVPRARPDEELYLGPALRMFDGSLDPGLLWYGFTEGFTIVLHGLLRLYAALLGWQHGVEVHLACLFALQPTTVLLVGRLFSAVLGTATLVPCAVVARRLVAPERAVVAGRIGALLLAVNYLHGRDSHFGVPDAALTFALTAALACLVRSIEDGRARDAIMAGAFGGLATALKWTGLFALPVILAVEALVVLRFRAARPWRHVGTSLLAVLAFGVVFVALDPHVPTQLAQTIGGLRSHAMRYGDESLGHLQDPSVQLGRGVEFHTRVTLPIAFGWVGLLLAGIGLAASWRRRPWPASACALFLGALFVVAVGPTRLLFVRYCMPIVPTVAALAAAGLVALTDVARVRASARIASALFVVLAIGAAVPPALRLVAADARLARADTRTLAAAWVAERGGDEPTLVPYLVYASAYAIPAEGAAACRAALPRALHAAVAMLPPIVAEGWEPWAPAVARGRAGYGAVTEQALGDYWNIPGLTPVSGDYAVFGQPLLACGKPSVIRGMPHPDSRCHVEVARFSPGRPSCDAVYDLFDQFYLPYDGFAGIDRPGPELVVYRNVCKVR